MMCIKHDESETFVNSIIVLLYSYSILEVPNLLHTITLVHQERVFRSPAKLDTRYHRFSGGPIFEDISQLYQVYA